MLLTERAAWKKLENHCLRYRVNQIHQTETSRLLCADDISLDYQHQKIPDGALSILLDMAEECNIKQALSCLVTGSSMNQDKPALHTALRAFDTPIWVAGIDILSEVNAAREHMREISNTIRCGAWLGRTGKSITHIVNIGIGGSMLGPQFCIDALAEWSAQHLTYHFMSDFDVNAFRRLTQRLDPDATLFIVSSKSFTTAETLWNAKKIKEWGGYNHYCAQHFIAVTAHTARAEALGFERTVPIWDWVGGRYSVCSAISLIACIAIGYDRFTELLQGAAAMDAHCLQAKGADNLPLMLALLGVWNNNYLKIHNLLVLTYAQSLQLFVPYLQQLEMESNGKSIDKQGRSLNYPTVPVIWGGSGNQAQHSYFQMLSQGTHPIAADLISIRSLNNELVRQHGKYLSEETTKQLDVERDTHRFFTGNHLQLLDNSARSVGALIALYEHKVFIQSVLWNINPFDQPGVDAMKQASIAVAPPSPACT
jgi:glucose-6-phosphate isomerase